MNVFLFTGHLGRDSDVKYAQSGTAICSFPVAVKTGYGQNEKTTWVQCALFGKRAEGELPKYLLKGAQVCIAGEVSLNEWQAQDGTNKAAIRVAVDKLDLIGGKPQPAVPQQQQPAPQQQAPQQQQPNNAGGMGDFDDSIYMGCCEGVVIGTGGGGMGWRSGDAGHAGFISGLDKRERENNND